MDIKIIRMKRKTISLKVENDLSVTLKVPIRMQDRDIVEFLKKHKEWIEKQRCRIAADNSVESAITPDEERRLRSAAKEYFEKEVKKYSEIMGLYPTGVKITSAKTRFGSCSPKNSLCFSWYLMLYPKAAAEYVVVHELAHIKIKNHGKDFYALVQRYMPDYKERKKLLRRMENGTDRNG